MFPLIRVVMPPPGGGADDSGNACAIPEIVVAFGARYLALVIGTTLVRIGEIKAAIRVANHIVGSVETPAFVVVDQ